MISPAWTGALMVFFVSCARAQDTTDLCYQMSWNLKAEKPKTVVIKPVTAFPKEHALVQNQYCGQNFKTGDPIPKTGMWFKDRSSSCEAAPGGKMFYAYDKPQGASSNNGFTQAEHVLIFFISANDTDLSFAVVNDAPGNKDGGTLRLALDSPALANKGVNIVQQDDPQDIESLEACRTADNDCYAYDSEEGKGSFYWKWLGCCTDGAAIGPMPVSDFRFSMKFSDLSGVDLFQFGNFNPATNEMGFINLSIDEVADEGIKVETFNCREFCIQKSSCGECTSDPNCGWCGNEDGGECLPVAAQKNCPRTRIWSNPGDCCPACFGLENCGDCTAVAGCGWSFDSAKCLTGADVDGALQSCEQSKWTVFDPKCPLAPGPVLAISTVENPTPLNSKVDDWCSGHGVVDFANRACVSCDPGYFGSDCSQECPGGSNNPCAGHGSCDQKTGECLCDCGFIGSDCSVQDGCVCSEVCLYGDACNTACGRVQSDNSCTGIFDDDEFQRRAGDSLCACNPGWWGKTCNATCPGFQLDGTGLVCGGLGSCNVESGKCECDPCSVLNDAGICVPEPCDLDCNSNFGVCTCDAATGEKSCRCSGATQGDLCNECGCQNGGSCNSISGDCDCPEGHDGPLCECTPLFCNNHGTCRPLSGTCDCDPGYSGAFCQPTFSYETEVVITKITPDDVDNDMFLDSLVRTLNDYSNKTVINRQQVFVKSIRPGSAIVTLFFDPLRRGADEAYCFINDIVEQDIWRQDLAEQDSVYNQTNVTITISSTTCTGCDCRRVRKALSSAEKAGIGIGVILILIIIGLCVLWYFYPVVSYYLWGGTHYSSYAGMDKEKTNKAVLYYTWLADKRPGLDMATGKGQGLETQHTKYENPLFDDGTEKKPVDKVTFVNASYDEAPTHKGLFQHIGGFFSNLAKPSSDAPTTFVNPVTAEETPGDSTKSVYENPAPMYEGAPVVAWGNSQDEAPVGVGAALAAVDEDSVKIVLPDQASQPAAKPTKPPKPGRETIATDTGFGLAAPAVGANKALAAADGQTVEAPTQAFDPRGNDSAPAAAPQQVSIPSPAELAPGFVDDEVADLYDSQEEDDGQYEAPTPASVNFSAENESEA